MAAQADATFYVRLGGFRSTPPPGVGDFFRKQLRLAPGMRAASVNTVGSGPKEIVFSFNALAAAQKLIELVNVHKVQDTTKYPALFAELVDASVVSSLPMPPPPQEQRYQQQLQSLAKQGITPAHAGPVPDRPVRACMRSRSRSAGRSRKDSPPQRPRGGARRRDHSRDRPSRRGNRSRSRSRSRGRAGAARRRSRSRSRSGSRGRWGKRVQRRKASTPPRGRDADARRRASPPRDPPRDRPQGTERADARAPPPPQGPPPPGERASPPPQQQHQPPRDPRPQSSPLPAPGTAAGAGGSAAEYVREKMQKLDNRVADGTITRQEACAALERVFETAKGMLCAKGSQPQAQYQAPAGRDAGFGATHGNGVDHYPAPGGPVAQHGAANGLHAPGQPLRQGRPPPPPGPPPPGSW
eukprot:TRINITY_DN18176_c1_g1_i1.p1 TRINITY_DN18176_c1_g1~~TRINITY_DN18176_c1_g1_i1.p1  ORF type:complete len:449 (+),score=76.93 TRINITY_DN18176_c1_g1_i1:113-1348(+)